MPTKRTIKEVKEYLQTIDDVRDPFIKDCLEDSRKGVQLAVQQWQRRQDKKEALRNQFKRMNLYEDETRAKGYHLIAGIDEVGRGPLAGPVVAAAVILDDSQPIIGLDDSKKLSLTKRMVLFTKIQEQSIAVGIGIVDSKAIDRYNILGATKIAMEKAVSNLAPLADFLLVDAVPLDLDLPKMVMNQGDSKSNSIAAASIIAKVTRDQLMEDYGREYPGYGFENNAGYGTKEHIDGLKKQGITPIHRHSFAPVRKYS